MATEETEREQPLDSGFARLLAPERDLADEVLVLARQVREGETRWTMQEHDGRPAFVLHDNSDGVKEPLFFPVELVDALTRLRDDYATSVADAKARDVVLADLQLKTVRDAIAPSLREDQDADATARGVRDSLLGVRRITDLFRRGR